MAKMLNIGDSFCLHGRKYLVTRYVSNKVNVQVVSERRESAGNIATNTTSDITDYKDKDIAFMLELFVNGDIKMMFMSSIDIRRDMIEFCKLVNVYQPKSVNIKNIVHSLDTIYLKKLTNLYLLKQKGEIIIMDKQDILGTFDFITPEYMVYGEYGFMDKPMFIVGL